MQCVKFMNDRQRYGEHVTAVMNNHETREKLLEVVFSTWSVQKRLYNENQWEVLVSQEC
jgi:hypothetical protein